MFLDYERKKIGFFRMLKYNNQDIDQMKNRIIDYTRPIYIERCNKDDFWNKISIYFFDKRIKTLPKKLIIEMNDVLDYVIKLEKSNKEDYKIMLSYLMDLVAYSFSLDRWLRTKVVNNPKLTLDIIHKSKK